MEPEGEPQPSTAGKIRVRAHGGRSRQKKPYHRRQISDSGIDESKGSQGLLSKVGSLIVPTWISNWFSKAEPKTSEDEDVSDDSEETIDVGKPMVRNRVLSQVPQGNHIGERNSISVNNNSVLKENALETEHRPLGYQSRKPSDKSELDDLSCTFSAGLSSTAGAEKARLFSYKRPTFTSSKASTSDDSSVSFSRQQVADKDPKVTLGSTDSVFGGTLVGGNVSVFGTPKPFLSKTTSPAFKVSSFVTSRSSEFSSTASSPFYKGRTTFGGASSVLRLHGKRQRMSPVASSVQLPKTKIQVRELCDRGKETVSGATAKRILRALEKMSSPVQDAKRMPTRPLMTVPDFSSEKSKPPTDVRTTVGPAAVAADAGSMTENKQLTVDRSKITVPTPVPSFKPKGLPLSFSPEECSTMKRQSFKMKRQKTYSHQPSTHPDESENETPNVSAIPECTPFIVKSLPKFDFVQQNKPAEKTGEMKVTVTTATVTSKDNIKFSFTTPRDKAGPKQESSTATNPRGKFSFSKPATVAVSSGLAVTSSEPLKVAPKIPSTALPQSKRKQNTVLSNLMSVDVITPKLSSPKGSWECNQCLIKNKADRESCIACGHERISSRGPVRKKASNSEQPSTEIETRKNHKIVKATTPIENAIDTGKKTSIFAKFAPKPGSWECDSCMIRNDADKTQCSACMAEKPAVEQTKNDVTAVKKDVSIFGKFAPKPGSWECGVCMVQNDAGKVKCVACEEPKPGNKPSLKVKPPSSVPQPKIEASILAKFAPKPGSWECEVCMIQNDADKVKCVSCEAEKPQQGSKDSAKEPIKVDPSPFAKFTPKSGSWECDVCMVRNDGEKMKCEACEAPKPGARDAAQVETKSQNKKASEGPKFSFGLPADTGNKPKFSFGMPQGGVAPNMKFGVQPTIDSSKIKFGVSSASESKHSTSGVPLTFGLKPASGGLQSAFAPKLTVQDSKDVVPPIPTEPPSKPPPSATFTGVKAQDITAPKVVFGSVGPTTTDGREVKPASEVSTSNQISFGFVPIKQSEKKESDTGRFNATTESSIPSTSNSTTEQPKFGLFDTSVKPNSLPTSFSFAMPNRTTNAEAPNFSNSVTTAKTGFQFSVTTSSQPVSLATTGLVSVDDSGRNASQGLFQAPSSALAVSKPVNSTPLTSTPFSNIAEAAKGGFLQVPNVDEKQTDSAITSAQTVIAQPSLFVANGPLPSQTTPLFGANPSNFVFSNSSSISSLKSNNQSVSTEPGIINPSTAPLFGKPSGANSTSVPGGSTNEVAPQNPFAVGLAAVAQPSQGGAAPKLGFNFSSSSNSSSIFGQSTQDNTSAPQSNSVPSFNFGGANTSAPSFGGFSFSQATSVTTGGTTELKFGFANTSSAAVPQQSWGGSLAGGFDFSASSTLKTGELNFIGNSSTNNNQGTLFGGSLGGQQPMSQPLFNVGAGATQSSAMSGGNRSQGMPVRKMKRATRRLGKQ